ALSKFHNDSDIDAVFWGANVHAEKEDENDSVEGTRTYHKIKVFGKQLLTDQICLRTPVTAWNKLYKAEIINKHQLTFPDGLLFEDNAFFWNYITHCKYGYYLKNYFYNYIRRENSIMTISNNKKSNRLYDRLLVFENFFKYYKNIGKIQEKQELISEIFCRAYCDEYRNSPNIKKVVKRSQKLVNRMKLQNDKRDIIKKLRRGIAHTEDYYSLREDLFSIKDKDNKKILSILGLKFKIPNTSLLNQFKSEKEIEQNYLELKKQINDLRYRLGELQKDFLSEAVCNIETKEPEKAIIKDYSYNYDQKIISRLKELDNFYFYPNNGNLGDVVIAQAEYQMLDNNQFNYEIFNAYNSSKTPDNDFNVVYGGGGLFVKYWNYQKVIDLFLNPNLKNVVILPSSFWECNDLLEVLDERFTVFCREKRSYDYCVSHNSSAKFYLVDDMAFSLDLSFINENSDSKISTINEETILSLYQNAYNPYKRVSRKLSDALKTKTKCIHKGSRLAYFLRNDAERYFDNTHFDIIDLSKFACSSCVDKGIVYHLSKLFIMAINSVNIVVTDRLHVGIAGALLGKEVLLLDNTYKKVSGVYEQSMSNMKNVKFVSDIKDVGRIIESLKNIDFNSDFCYFNNKLSFSKFMREYYDNQKNAKIAEKISNTIWE
ncbi:MAG: polysaccharide pyruvyl transferase family protein, partial [Candidatus Gastranaerophilales bacterium]|nr:polysaccharide pyruvyl transferase family protein [Candidatus Gastranaerophilales bacterium]